MGGGFEPKSHGWGAESDWPADSSIHRRARKEPVGQQRGRVGWGHPFVIAKKRKGTVTQRRGPGLELERSGWEEEGGGAGGLAEELRCSCLN